MLCVSLLIVCRRTGTGKLRSWGQNLGCNGSSSGLHACAQHMSCIRQLQIKHLTFHPGCAQAGPAANALHKKALHHSCCCFSCCCAGLSSCCQGTGSYRPAVCCWLSCGHQESRPTWCIHGIHEACDDSSPVVHPAFGEECPVCCIMHKHECAHLRMSSKNDKCTSCRRTHPRTAVCLIQLRASAQGGGSHPYCLPANLRAANIAKLCMYQVGLKGVQLLT